MKDRGGRLLFGVLVVVLAIQAVLAIAANTVFVRVGAGAGAVLLAFAAWSLRGQWLLSETETKSLKSTQQQLQATVQERDAELVMANERLKEENLEHRWLNQALEHQLHYADLIINSIADAVVIVSKAMKITRVNASLVHHSGFTQPEVIGKPLELVVRPAFERGENQKEALRVALNEERELLNRPAYLVAKNGAITQASLSLYLVRDDDKVVAGVVALRLQLKAAVIPAAKST